MNKEIIVKWDRENDRESVEKRIWKSRLEKIKCHCSLSKQYKNVANLLEMLLYF